jgi:hypothetical protein
MKPLSAAALAVGFAFGCFHSTANAAVPIAYVDSVAGNDANAPTCARTTPCKTMATALANITDPGVVAVVADSEFAPFTITKGHSITCVGVKCIVNSSGGATGITIAAGVNDTVVLTDIAITGLGTGGIGIDIASASKVQLNHSTVSGNATGINFSPTSGASSHLFLNDSEVRYSSGLNISVAPTAGVNASAMFVNSRIHHGRSGLVANGTTGGSGISLNFERTTVNFHNNNGIAVVAAGSGCPSTPSGPFVRALITRSVVSYTTNGLLSSGCSAQIFLDGTMVTGATNGIVVQDNGIVTTTSNNAVGFNSTNVIGTLFHMTPQ